MQLGRITKMTINGKDNTYDYDNIGQVKNDDGSGITYDANGNRTSGGTTPIAGNRLQTDGIWNYGYDDAGHVISRSKAGEAWTYKYSVGGQMTEASNGTTTVDYAYDVFSNRIARTVSASAGSSVERYAVDGWDTAKPSAVGTENFDTWADLTSDGKGGWTAATRRLFGAGQDQVLARESASGDVAWYGTDQIGSVRLVFDNSATVVGKADYSAFGAITLVVAAGMERYQFTGREWDGTLKLQFNRARLYDPVSGRFFGEDPKGFAAGDPNLSRYVMNGATTGRDPSGMEDFGKQPPIIFKSAINCHNGGQPQSGGDLRDLSGIASFFAKPKESKPVDPKNQLLREMVKASIIEEQRLQAQWDNMPKWVASDPRERNMSRGS